MVRQARLDDFSAIIKIRNSRVLNKDRLLDTFYTRTIQKNGFLLPYALTQQIFAKEITKLFLVYEQNEKVTGYIRIDPIQEMKSTTQVIWYHPELQELYFSQPHAALGGIAVFPSVDKKGIATALLAEAIKILKSSGHTYIFALVVISPITNFSSMMFHEKNLFERIAITSHSQLFGLRNYQSILYGKKL